MVEKKENSDISKLSFEQAIKKLTDIVSKIEQGQISLEQSLAQYEQGMELIKHCRAILQKAEKKIEEISKEKD
jgi:exodeoxyribonuclease VII small subunit